VLPIGGLKEKLIAAVRGGIETVLIPKENERDLKEIPVKVKRRLRIHTVENMDEVLVHALKLPHKGTLSAELPEYPLAEIFEAEAGVETPANVN
jgi:ATP-dependent Lon protease